MRTRRSEENTPGRTAMDPAGMPGVKVGQCAKVGQ